MSQFDILDPDLALDKKYFIEASAGCGKTFSIENAYVRLIMESKYDLSVESILVLTFTKEATSELRARIRSSLKYAKDQLEADDSKSFEYILRCRAMPIEDRARVSRNLEDALANFDSAQIFTIHKFCFLKLKQFLFQAQLDLSQDVEKAQISVKTYEQIVRDYFAFSLNEDTINSSQLRLLLGFYKNDFNLLLKASVMQLLKEVPVEKPQSFEVFCKSSTLEIEALIKLHGLNPELVYETLSKTAPFYKGAVNREKKLNPLLEKAFKAFSELFTKKQDLSQIEECLHTFSHIEKLFQDSNLKKSALKENRSESNWIILEVIGQRLFSHFRLAASKENLISLVAYESQKLLSYYFKQNNILTPNNILEKLLLLIQNKSVKKAISDQYQALIIDEFQDTDPIQWEILSEIFLKDQTIERPFYLVGDPKQSIYAFRKADIYTYLKAAQMMGVKEKQTLNINYRSQPQLIKALNDLFAEQSNKWITLPKLNSFLPYVPVLSSNSIEKKEFCDDRKSMHFIITEQNERAALSPSRKLEEELLFPFIVSEINKLQTKGGLKLNHFAILVRDRFQGGRLKSFLKKLQIPFTATRPESLQNLDSTLQFLQIYRCVLQPKNSRLIHRLKISTLLNWPIKFFEDENLPALIEYFSSLKTLLLEKGFLAFYQSLVSQQSLLRESLYQRLLSSEEGIYLYQEFEQIKELLLQKEIEGSDPYELLNFLEDLSKQETLPEKTYPLRQNFEEDGVQILTLHMSKGLEFEIIFALGLVNQVTAKEDLVLLKANKLLSAASLTQKELKEHFQELDAEKLRTLYVALTRAKQRLYIPCVFSEKKQSLGQCSSMDLFLQKLNLDLPALKSFVSKHPEMSFSHLKEKLEIEKTFTKPNSKLIAPTKLELNFTKRFKHSFTSLSSSTHHSIRDLSAPHDFETQDKNIYTLPAGSHTGSLIHKIMETISFTSEFDIDPLIMKTPFEPWREVIKKWIEKILHTPIVVDDLSFSLSGLEKKQVYKEIEFLYPTDGKIQVQEMNLQGSSLNGFIDLVCNYQGKYFLVDYKTNWLGASSLDYSSLEQAMQEHQYLLQATIYKEALKKYIEAFESRPFNECFGGIIYWFIRGVDHPNSGLYIIK